MLKLVVVFGAFAVLFSCSSEPKLLRTESINISETGPEREQNPDTDLTLEISGMTCVMGCGGSISSALIKTGSVANCDFDFKEGRKMNTAQISYNSSEISAEEIKKIISELNDKQFTTGDSTETKIQTIEKIEEKS